MRIIFQVVKGILYSFLIVITLFIFIPLLLSTLGVEYILYSPVVFFPVILLTLGVLVVVFIVKIINRKKPRMDQTQIKIEEE